MTLVPVVVERNIKSVVESRCIKLSAELKTAYQILSEHVKEMSVSL